MEYTIGECSICGGRVTLPESWAGVNPPIPKCKTCGATKENSHGDVVEMEKPKRDPWRTVASLKRDDHEIAQYEATCKGAR